MPICCYARIQSESLPLSEPECLLVITLNLVAGTAWLKCYDGIWDEYGTFKLTILNDNDVYMKNMVIEFGTYTGLPLNFQEKTSRVD